MGGLTLPTGRGGGAAGGGEEQKPKKKRKHLPAGLGPGPQGSPTHHERSVGILIHCRSTGERKSFFLSLCPTLPVHTGGRHGRWAEGAAAGRAPPPQFIGRFGAAPTVSCKHLQPIRDPRSLHDQNIIHQNHRRFLGRVETRSCDEVGDKFWLGWLFASGQDPAGEIDNSKAPQREGQGPKKKRNVRNGSRPSSRSGAGSLAAGGGGLRQSAEVAQALSARGGL